MALPRLNTPTYELELPSTGEKIKYRPFLIKEQKLLLIAQESGEDSQLMDAMIELVLSCTFGKIDANKYPIFDVEYLFLQIRARSVGETVDLNLICPDDGETQVPVTINLQELSVAVKEEHSNIAKLNDKISIHFRYPILSDMKGLQGQASEMETMFHVINNCVNEIHDGDEIYRRIDMSESEINEFIDSLSAKQFEKITEFFQTTPKLRHVIKVTNPKTKVKGEVVLEGLTDFLG
jgi:hypothetical protein|tara:strand:+ start:434 stop:1141 length:708 start_codon:yes stop_codon:yes gene_type:complete